MPDVFFEVSFQRRIKPDDYLFHIRTDDPKGVPHVLVQVKVIRGDESFIGHMEKLDAIQDKHADLIVYMTPADQVQSPIEEPDLIRIHFACSLTLRRQRIIPHLNDPTLHNSLMDLLNDFLELRIVLERFETDVEGLLNAPEIREALRRQGGLDFSEELIQGFIKDRVFEDPEDVPVEVETHQLRDGEGNRQVKLVALYKAVSAFGSVFFGVEGKTGSLNRSQITPDGAGVTAFFFSKFSHSDPLLAGLNCPQDAPLPG